MIDVFVYPSQPTKCPSAHLIGNICHNGLSLCYTFISIVFTFWGLDLYVLNIDISWQLNMLILTVILADLNSYHRVNREIFHNFVCLLN